jgi:hypothetical protein
MYLRAAYIMDRSLEALDKARKKKEIVEGQGNDAGVPKRPKRGPRKAISPFFKHHVCFRLYFILL